MLATLTFLLAGCQSTDAAPRPDFSSWTSAEGNEADVFTAVRFLDAETSRPLSGVTVELWTEENTNPARAATRLAMHTSGADGGLWIPAGVPNVRAEKFRVSRAGYASREIHGALEMGEFLLQPSLARSFRVLDLDGRPIANATLSLRESCHHAVPATTGTTDAAGEVTLSDYPTGFGELEVVADGFGTLSHRLLDHSLLDERAALRGEPVELRMARRPGYELLLVDSAGKPLAGRRPLDMAGPIGRERSDASGRVRYPSRGFERTGLFEFADERPAGELDVEGLPTLGATRVACYPEDRRAPTGDTELCIAVVLQPDAAKFDLGVPRIVVRTALGRAARANDDPLAGLIRRESLVHACYLAPPGPTRVRVGAPFSGWCEEVVDFELVPGGPTPSIRGRPEAQLLLTLPEDALFLHVQAGNDSITLNELRGEALACFVPPERRVVLWLEGEHGSAYRAELSPLTSGEVRRVSLVDACVRKAPLVAELPKRRLRFDVRVVGGSADGADAEPVHARLTHALGDNELELDSTSHFEFELPRGDLFRLRLDCEARNCVPLQLVARVPDVAESARSLELVARARVTFERAQIVFGPGASSVNPSYTETWADNDGLDLAPGLALLEVQTNGVSRTVEVDLKPGEVRALEEP